MPEGIGPWSAPWGSIGSAGFVPPANTPNASQYVYNGGVGSRLGPGVLAGNNAYSLNGAAMPSLYQNYAAPGAQVAGRLGVGAPTAVAGSGAQGGGGLYSQIYADLAAFGQNQLQDAARAYGQHGADAHQYAYGHGLADTTRANSLQRGVTADYDRQVGQINNDIRSQRAGVGEREAALNQSSSQYASDLAFRQAQLAQQDRQFAAGQAQQLALQNRAVIGGPGYGGGGGGSGAGLPRTASNPYDPFGQFATTANTLAHNTYGSWSPSSYGSYNPYGTPSYGQSSFGGYGNVGATPTNGIYDGLEGWDVG